MGINITGKYANGGKSPHGVKIENVVVLVLLPENWWAILHERKGMKIEEV